MVNQLKGAHSESQYQNINYLDKGGMGQIYTADDVINKTKVAIKFIKLDDLNLESLLKSEFDMALKLNHPHIVNTYYADKTEINNTWYFYSVMELASNGSLKKIISGTSNQIPIDGLISYMLQLSEGLSFAHNTIIHRDLKPENILVSSSGDLKICDFGIAKYVGELTRTKTFKGWGTVFYMAPECWLFDTNSIQMDVYSLGIIFYELCTLQKPFVGRNEREIREKHLYESLPNLQSVRNDLPIKLVEIINKMTRKRASERYNTMNEVIDALKTIQTAVTQTTDSKIDSIVRKAHSRIVEQEKEKLHQKRKSEEKISGQKLIDYSIEMLFNRFNEVIDKVNDSLEQSQILKQKGMRALNISFLNRYVSVSFHSPDLVNNYIEIIKKRNIDFQRERYGMIVSPQKELYLQIDNIIFTGTVLLSGSNYGFNLLLKRAENELYGEWWICWFEDSPLINKHPLEKHYPLSENELPQEYEIGRSNAMHIRRMFYKALQEEDIIKLIGKLID